MAYMTQVYVYLFVIIFHNAIDSSKSTFFPYVYPRLKLEVKDHPEAGAPLFITPFLKNGSIELAQSLSLVLITEFIGIRSHSGFFTINEEYNSNLYFWYFPPVNNNPDAPVLLWLQGGPGGTSLFGLFTELGPLIALKKGFKKRKYHWALNHHLIFIDNPVGTGFSFTKAEDGYCKDEICVGQGLYNALQQFFTLFPNLSKNSFFITGESYAGKYIPALATRIHIENSANTNKNIINLQGMAIGNGYCDPIHQVQYGNYLYQHGLLDDYQLQVFEEMQDKIVEQIRQENWLKADILMDQLMDGELQNFSYYKNYTGFTNYYNILDSNVDIDIAIFKALLENDNLRRDIHVGGLPFNDGEQVQLHLSKDMLKSMAPEISELLSNYRILFYSGQLDIVVAYPLTVNFLSNLKFASADEYSKAKRGIWMEDGELAGYVKKAGNLTEILVRNAGHMVPQDQPKWAWRMITRFVKNVF